MSERTKNELRIGRRVFLSGGTLLLAASGSIDATALLAEPPATAAGLRVGLITDLHYADKPPTRTRHYRQTPDKLAEAAAQFEADRPDFVVELGDLIDAADSVQVEQRYLRTINRQFAALARDRHYVLGNHCVDTLTKEEFLDGVEQAKSYYAFDRGAIRFLVLDACFRSDGQPYGRKNGHWTDANIPAAEIRWLTDQLRSTDRQVVVFVHQRLDVSNNHGIRNGQQIRQVLEAQDNVLAVFQGHSHKSDLSQINGIPYCTLVAMVEGSGAENNGYSMMHIDPHGNIRVQGFRRQPDTSFRRPATPG